MKSGAKVELAMEEEAARVGEWLRDTPQQPVSLPRVANTFVRYNFRSVLPSSRHSVLAKYIRHTPTATISYEKRKNTSTKVKDVASSESCAALRNGSWLTYLARDECVARESITWEEALAALRLSAYCYFHPITHTASELNAVEEAVTTTPAAARQATIKGQKSSMEISGNAVLVAILPTQSSSGAYYNSSFDSATSSSSSGTYSIFNANACTMWAHHVLHHAITTLAQRELICRSAIREEEALDFVCRITPLYEYEHRVWTVGTLPLENFLRKWIAAHRGRKLRHRLQKAQLEAREATARRDLEHFSKVAVGRYELFMSVLEELESAYRGQLTLLQMQAAYTTGIVYLRLAEMTERFPICFGCTMPNVMPKYGLVSFPATETTTAFTLAVLLEERCRSDIENRESTERSILPFTAMLLSIEHIFEPTGRIKIVKELDEKYAVARVMMVELETLYTLRTIEMYEAVERDVMHKEMTKEMSERCVVTIKGHQSPDDGHGDSCVERMASEQN